MERIVLSARQHTHLFTGLRRVATPELAWELLALVTRLAPASLHYRSALITCGTVTPYLCEIILPQGIIDATHGPAFAVTVYSVPW